MPLRERGSGSESEICGAAAQEGLARVGLAIEVCYKKVGGNGIVC